RATATTIASARLRLTLKDLLLADRDGLAPPGLVAGPRDVVARDAGGRALAIAHGEVGMIARGEMRRVGLPRGPLLARCTPGNTDDDRGYCSQSQASMRTHVRRPP